MGGSWAVLKQLKICLRQQLSVTLTLAGAHCSLDCQLHLHFHVLQYGTVAAGCVVVGQGEA
jgi:hypothetical protein